MTDQRLRELERRFRETGTPEAEEAWFRERVRAGELVADQVRLGAYCGYRPALLLASSVSPWDRERPHDLSSIHDWLEQAVQVLDTPLPFAWTGLCLLHRSRPAYGSPFVDRCLSTLTDYCRRPSAENTSRVKAATAPACLPAEKVFRNSAWLARPEPAEAMNAVRWVYQQGIQLDRFTPATAAGAVYAVAQAWALGDHESALAAAEAGLGLGNA